MNALILTLLIPLLSSVVMAFLGQKKIAGYLNIIFSLAQFVVALFLTSAVFNQGHIGASNGQFYI